MEEFRQAKAGVVSTLSHDGSGARSATGTGERRGVGTASVRGHRVSSRRRVRRLDSGRLGAAEHGPARLGPRSRGAQRSSWRAVQSLWAHMKCETGRRNDSACSVRPVRRRGRPCYVRRVHGRVEDGGHIEPDGDELRHGPCSCTACTATSSRCARRSSTRRSTSSGGAQVEATPGQCGVATGPPVDSGVRAR
jgi:hypothetical protein